MERLGVDPAEVSPTRMAYELAKLRGKGLVRKVSGRNLYTLTDLGYRSTVALTKLHQRLLSPTLDTLDRRSGTRSARRPTPWIPPSHASIGNSMRSHERVACNALPKKSSAKFAIRTGSVFLASARERPNGHSNDPHRARRMLAGASASLRKFGRMSL